MEQFQLQSEPNPDAARPVPLADAFRQNTSHRCAPRAGAATTAPPRSDAFRWLACTPEGAAGLNYHRCSTTAARALATRDHEAVPYACVNVM